MHNRFGRRGNLNSSDSILYNDEYNTTNDITYIINKYNEHFDEPISSYVDLSTSLNIENSNNWDNINVNFNKGSSYVNVNLEVSNSIRNNDSGNEIKESNNQVSNLASRCNYECNPRSSFNKNNNSVMYRLSELEDSNLYKILNVNETDSLEKIKKSFKLLCFKNHPDKGGNSDNFLRIAEAYRILSNETYRSLYDEYGSKALEYLSSDIDNSFDINGDNKEIDIEILRTFLECKN